MKEKLNINLFKLPEHKCRQGQLETTHKGSHYYLLTHKLIEVSRGPSTEQLHPGKIISVQDFRLVSPRLCKSHSLQYLHYADENGCLPNWKEIGVFVLLDQDLQKAISLHAGDMTNLLEKKMSFTLLSFSSHFFFFFFFTYLRCRFCPRCERAAMTFNG